VVIPKAVDMRSQIGRCSLRVILFGRKVDLTSSCGSGARVQRIDYQRWIGNGKLCRKTECRLGPPSMAVAQVPLLSRPSGPSPGSAEMILSINCTHTNDAELIWKVVAAVHDLSNPWIDHVMFVYFKLVRFAGRLRV